MKKFLLLAAAAFMANGMYAQNEDYDRVSAGYSLMFFNEKYYDDIDNLSGTDKYHGGEINYVHGFSVSDRLPMFVEAGLRLSFNTCRETTGEYKKKNIIDDRTNFIAVSVPVNFTYRFELPNDFYIAPYAGVQFRFNALAELKGKIAASDGIMAYKVNLISDDDYRRFQFGGQVGVNFGYEHFNFGVAYMMRTPIASYNYDEFRYKYRTNELSCTIGYNF